MSVHGGPANWWTEGNGSGRTYMSTKVAIQTNLVLNLDAGASSSYSGSGTTWTDLTGNGNNGTLVNSPTFSTDNGGCFVFNGSSTYISFVSSTSFSFGTGDFTVDYWVRYNSFPNLTSVLDMRNSGPGVGFSEYTTTTGNFRVYRYPSNIFTATSNFSASTWYNITITRISGSESVYFNAVQNGSSFSEAVDYTNNGLILGTNVTRDATAYTNGSIACVKIYKGLGLSQAQITQNFNTLRARFGV